MTSEADEKSHHGNLQLMACTRNPICRVVMGKFMVGNLVSNKNLSMMCFLNHLKPVDGQGYLSKKKTRTNRLRVLCITATCNGSKPKSWPLRYEPHSFTSLNSKLPCLKDSREDQKQTFLKNLKDLRNHYLSLFIRIYLSLSPPFFFSPHGATTINTFPHQPRHQVHQASVTAPEPLRAGGNSELRLKRKFGKALVTRWAPRPVVSRSP